MSRRALWPREHGAYFQLAVPLATACVRHLPTVATLTLATSACLAFLANEPLLVWLGHRGQRMRDVDGRRARSRLAVLAAGALALGVLGLSLAPDPTLTASAVVAGPVALLVVLAWRRAERTVAGELIAAIALTGASVPVLVAGGSALGAALALWLSWSVGFGATVLAIHRVIARHKHPAAPIDRVLALGLLATAIAGGTGAWPGSATAAPLAALAALLVIAPPPASRLRAIGVTTAAMAAVSGVVAWIVVA